MLLRRLTVLLVAVALAGSALAQTNVAPPRVGVSPSRVEVDISQGSVTESVRVFNFGAETIDIQVSLANWDLDEGNQVRTLPPTEQSLDQWMIVNPLQFTVDPGESQVVRFAIRPRVEPSPGEHRGMLFFEERTPPEEEPGVRFQFRVGVAVYAYSGRITRTAVLHGLKLTGEGRDARLAFDLTATGNAHVRPSGTLTVHPAKADAADEPTVSSAIPAAPVLPGTRRTVRVALPRDLPAGDYRIRVEGTAGDITFDQGFPWTVPPTPTPAATPEPSPNSSPTPARAPANTS